MEIIFRKIEHRVPELLSKIEQDMNSYSAIFLQFNAKDKNFQDISTTRPYVQLISSQMSRYKGWTMIFLDGDIISIFKDVENLKELKNLENLIKMELGQSESFKIQAFQFPFNYKNFAEVLLSKIEIRENGNNGFGDIDLNNYIRKQPICGILSNNKIEILFNEIFLNFERLERANNLPNHNIHLRNYNKYTLNQQLLNFLCSDMRVLLGGHSSLNLSPESILSDSFKNFHKLTSMKLDHNLIIEIDIVDAFCDLEKLFMAIEYLKKIGYKVCLDGLNELSLSLIRAENLDIDFAKIIWYGDIYSINNSSYVNAFKKAIDNFNHISLIIGNCSSSEIINLGKKLGIHLFQGLECDQMLKNKNKDFAFI